MFVHNREGVQGDASGSPDLVFNGGDSLIGRVRNGSDTPAVCRGVFGSGPTD